MIKNKTLTIILFVFYFLIITVSLVIPTKGLSHFSLLSILPIRADYIIHVVIFFPWCLFLFTFTRINKWLWFFLGVLLGAFFEFVQMLLPYRTGDYDDIIADAVGVLLGFAVFFIISNNKKK